jgi:hypothetical protein
MHGDGFDPFRILASLRAHGVRAVVVGGLAASAYGSPVATDDVDVCLAGDEENLQRLGLALADLGGTMVSDLSQGSQRASFVTVAGRLDCIETDRYDELEARAAQVELGRGVVARIASVEDLAELKRAAGDLRGAAHVASLLPEVDVRERVVELQPEDAPPVRDRTRVRDRIWGALEDVDTFLTNLTERR